MARQTANKTRLDDSSWFCKLGKFINKNIPSSVLIISPYTLKQIALKRLQVKNSLWNFRLEDLQALIFAEQMRCL